MLLTLEPPRDTVVTVLEVIERSKRCPLIVTASPPIEGPPLAASKLRLIDYLIATELELRYMLEDAGDDDDALSVQDIVHRLLLAGVGTICVLGPNQCRIYGVPDDFVQPPPAALITTDQSASMDAFAAGWRRESPFDIWQPSRISIMLIMPCWLLDNDLALRPRSPGTAK